MEHGQQQREICTSLKAVVIPDTVDSISNYCFQHCEGAESLTIPGNLDFNAVNIPFYDMKCLKDIYITPGKTGAGSCPRADTRLPGGKNCKAN